ncbi:MAG TPA: hypothetical protein DCZ94_14820 [Lentisphaeria bacterium]|nr:MAG: hypothetical protein A2X48_02975 [Lentisphaerae bacterium GWF2_49_21]HBC88221.1 hypothetical protein [Lentisphaeria bacterium]
MARKSKLWIAGKLPDLERRPVEYGAVLLLLAIHLLLVLSAAVQNSPVFDESVHISGGLSYWCQNDYRLNPENGNFPQRWASLPLVFQKLTMPDLLKTPLVETDSWSVGRELLFSSKHSPGRILLCSRMFIALLSIITALAVYFSTRKIFGVKGALFSLFLYSLYPEMLAHAGFTTSDMATALAFTLSVICIWNVLHQITVKNILLSSFALGLLFISKFSAVIIIPVYLILIFARLFRNEPLECSVFHWKKTFAPQSHRLLAHLSVSFVNALVIFTVIWAAYGFRFSMLANDNAQDRQVLDANFRSFCKSAPETKVLIPFRDHSILPEAYLFGFAFVMKYSKARYTFINGETDKGGCWYFFPYAFLLKNPIPLLVIFLLSALSITGYFPHVRQYFPREKLYQLLPFIVFSAVYAIFAVSSSLNIGHRHLLPVYPALFIISASAIYFFLENSKFLKITLVILLAWYAFETFWIQPHYLAYFNQLGGGPKNGYKCLVDSSLDWGQDLKTLRGWLDGNKKPGETVYVSYFGTADMNYYLSDVRKLPCYFEQDRGSFDPFGMKAGIYCISATMFQLVYFETAFREKTGMKSSEINEGLFRSLSAEIRDYFNNSTSLENIKSDPKELTKYLMFKKKFEIYSYLRYAKLCLYLHKKKPDAYAGYSILIFRLTDKDIEDALSN